MLLYIPIIRYNMPLLKKSIILDTPNTTTNSFPGVEYHKVVAIVGHVSVVGKVTTGLCKRPKETATSNIVE